MKQGERSTDHSFYLELVYFYCEWNSSRFQYWPKIQPHTLSRSGVFLQLVEILKTLDLNIILQISHLYLVMARMTENEGKWERLIYLSYQSKSRLKRLNVVMENRKYSICFTSADWLNVTKIILSFFLIPLFSIKTNYT